MSECIIEVWSGHKNRHNWWEPSGYGTGLSRTSFSCHGSLSTPSHVLYVYDCRLLTNLRYTNIHILVSLTRQIRVYLSRMIPTFTGKQVCIWIYDSRARPCPEDQENMPEREKENTIFQKIEFYLISWKIYSNFTISDAWFDHAPKVIMLKTRETLKLFFFFCVFLAKSSRASLMVTRLKVKTSTPALVCYLLRSYFALISFTQKSLEKVAFLPLLTRDVTAQSCHNQDSLIVRGKKNNSSSLSGHFTRTSRDNVKCNNILRWWSVWRLLCYGW